MISSIIVIGSMVSGCGTLQRLIAPEDESPIVYRIQQRAVSVPDKFYIGCPPYINPPDAIRDNDITLADIEILGDWMTLIEANYGFCEETISNIKNEQERTENRFNVLNETPRTSEPD